MNKIFNRDASKLKKLNPNKVSKGDKVSRLEQIMELKADQKYVLCVLDYKRL